MSLAPHARSTSNPNASVKENLRVIDDIGQVLVNRGTLMGHEIDALIQSGLARAT